MNKASLKGICTNATARFLILAAGWEPTARGVRILFKSTELLGGEMASLDFVANADGELVAAPASSGNGKSLSAVIRRDANSAIDHLGTLKLDPLGLQFDIKVALFDETADFKLLEDAR